MSSFLDPRDPANHIEVWVDGELWQPISRLDQAGPSDNVYALDPESGTVTFGDGKQGRSPPAGSSLRVTYRHGRGREITVTHPWPLERASFAVDLRQSGELQCRVSSAGEGGSSSLRRVRYFSGQLLSAGDFQAEQDYFRAKHRWHNRHLHGYGIVQGLELSVAEGMVRVSAGLAIDARGEEIAIPQPVTLPLPTSGSSWYVTLAFAECETDPVPTSGPDPLQNSRVQEGYRIAFESAPPADAVALGRLAAAPEGWTLDRDFKPPRLR